MILNSDLSVIYLDNAATTYPKPENVYQTMDNFYRNYGGNAGRGTNPLARSASVLVEDTRSSLESWLNIPEVVFCPSATIALNTAILGAKLKTGDIVYVSPFEHNSVLRPLEYLRKSVGIRIEQLPFDNITFECKLDEVKALFDLEPPAMVCTSIVSNVLGLKLPIDELTILAKSSSESTITIIDGAQAAGLLEVEASRIDALIFSGHKSLYGPYGIAGIGFGTQWRPLPIIMGGTGTQSESIDTPDSGPSRYEAGSQNIQAIAGLNASLKWLKEVGRASICQHLYGLTKVLSNALSDFPNMTLFRPTNGYSHFGILSLAVDGIMPQAIETALGANRIAIRAGLHCSPWAHQFINSIPYGGTVRISLGQFNTKEDVFAIRDALSQLISVN